MNNLPNEKGFQLFGYVLILTTAGVLIVITLNSLMKGLQNKRVCVAKLAEGKDLY